MCAIPSVTRRAEGRKDGRTEGRKDGRTEGRKDGRTEGWKDGKTERWKDGGRAGQMDLWPDRWTDGGGQMDGWTIMVTDVMDIP